MAFASVRSAAVAAPIDGTDGDLPFGFAVPQAYAEAAAAGALTWAWTFEGATPASSTAQHPAVSFAAPGPKAVTLTVCDLYHQCETLARTVYVLDPTPDVAGLTVVPEIALVGETVTFQSSTVGGKGPMSHTWTVSGGPTLQGDPATWNTTGVAPGSYPFSLLVQNVDGQATLAGSLLVRAGFIRDWRAGCPVACSFARGAKVPFTLQLGNLVATSYLFEYDWNGDGVFDESASTPITAVHYGESGVYQPRLRVTAGAVSSTFVHELAIEISGGPEGFLFADGFDATASIGRWLTGDAEP